MRRYTPKDFNKRSYRWDEYFEVKNEKQSFIASGSIRASGIDEARRILANRMGKAFSAYYVTDDEGRTLGKLYLDPAMNIRWKSGNKTYSCSWKTGKISRRD